ncbi:uncharacterized protein SPAPADRAFT_143682 [Spathaspora passalidarum NRRL Y-27907]|uniref:Uncharacterized protein n=1 Tax=Spathaspora passalidarum (strain NRRL Y-27907 / 11-Y1) TaxID=619300 RepID=G3AUF3_SPAPN|nr:uncharacterized protein SPAPADRAFT_143682 [Spathaspora passalidarum NRRL Y-27907]EGW30530.1 hypothetical protein SPAPADRAFT_143682 [Spathaspora passalidarum NRRL Y-27907]
MAWLPFGNKDKSNAKVDLVQSPQIEQRSHQPMPTSDIDTTLNQISTPTSSIKVKDIQDTTDPKQAQAKITEFVQKDPWKTFIIDGEHNADQSIICTDTNDGKTCLKLGINSVKMFKVMQSLEYFCSLPNDVDATYFECRKIK